MTSGGRWVLPQRVPVSVPHLTGGFKKVEGMKVPAEKTSKSTVRLFGSSGVRGVVGEDLSEDVCRDVARAAGTMLLPRSRVCIATDTRVSREVVSSAVISGLRATGINVTELGILPTPALVFLTREMGFDGGVMITASHNPPEFNGIKLFNGDCIGYSRSQETEVERIYAGRAFREGPRGDLDQDHGAKEAYFRRVQDRFSDGSLGRRFRVVVDAGNGAAAGFASQLFERLGLDVIAVNDEPDGLFPGRSPEPGEDTLEGTVEVVRQQEADLAVCFDGDADRVVFLDRDGFLGFNEAVAFVARIAVESSGKKRVAATVETGNMVDLAVRDLGAEVVRGRVGDVFVAHLVRELDAGIGVEPAGVYIMPEMGFYPDSIFAALTLLSRIDRAEDIRRFFAKVPRLYSVQEKVPCPNAMKVPVMSEVRDRAARLGAGHINALDGLRLEFEDSWTLIRASGTEPLIRISAESGSGPKTEALLRQGAEMVERIVARLAA